MYQELVSGNYYYWIMVRPDFHYRITLIKILSVGVSNGDNPTISITYTNDRFRVASTFYMTKSELTILRGKDRSLLELVQTFTSQSYLIVESEELEEVIECLEQLKKIKKKEKPIGNH